MIYEPISRTLFAASLLAAACGTAAAQSAQVTVSSSPATLAGTVSIRDLSSRPQAAPLARPPVEMPRHRLPDGSPASPGKSLLESPPLIPHNVEVAPSVGSVNAFGGAVTGFVGIHSLDQLTANGFELEPPDQGLAVNNNVAAEINNLVLRFFNATTGAPLTAPISLFSFFNVNGEALADPQAFFDPTTGRWFFTVVDTLVANRNVVYFLDIAVSTTSDPLGSYFIYHVPAISTDIAACKTPGFGISECLPDYPKAGYDANGLYISVNLFGNLFGPHFVAAATYALPKSQLEAGAVSFTPVRFVYPGDFVVQPSVPAPGEPFVTAANGTEYLMEARNIVDRSHNIRVWAISNTNNIVSNPSSLRAFFVDVPGENYGRVVPATEPNVIGPFCKSVGAVAAPFLDGVYNSFQATVQLADGRLYGALPFGSVDGKGLLRDSVAWFALTPSVDSTGHPSASIFKQGYVVPPNGYSIINPAFGLSKSGAGALALSITNTSQNVPGGFPSAGLVQFTGKTHTGGIIVSGQGITSDDGFTGCMGTSPPGGVGRWGDYGVATVDAATGFFYVANENISGARTVATNWGTFITQLKTSLPLAARAALSWPTGSLHR
jgi:hypothetical protein